MLLKYTRLCDFEWVRRHTKTFYDYREADKDFYEVEVTSGSFMLLNRRLLGDAILLPEDYFMYFEDTDLCMRLRKKGKTMAHTTLPMACTAYSTPTQLPAS